MRFPQRGTPDIAFSLILVRRASSFSIQSAPCSRARAQAGAASGTRSTASMLCAPPSQSASALPHLCNGLFHEPHVQRRVVPVIRCRCSGGRRQVGEEGGMRLQALARPLQGAACPAQPAPAPATSTLHAPATPATAVSASLRMPALSAAPALWKRWASGTRASTLANPASAATCGWAGGGVGNALAVGEARQGGGTAGNSACTDSARHQACSTCSSMNFRKSAAERPPL